MTDAARVEVRVDGVVQGVGFRPFVYRTAVAHDLAGRVRNLGDAGVAIALEGDREDIDGFLDVLRTDPPPLSRVESVAVEAGEPEGLETFEILPSTAETGGSGTVPPDTGICDSCLSDVRDPDARYHRYWATACVDCGPRFTVIRDLPYDRPRTSMDEFPMCEACAREYEDPGDRRYHAQAIACPDCGPRLSLVDPTGEALARGPDAISPTADRLAAGDLVAIKGVGGTHLACDATDPAVVQRLRDRTNRPEKPFALMAPSVDSLASVVGVSGPERAALTDVRRPIVLLERTGDLPWLDAVAPGLHTVGAMLPYSGLHHLLFDDLEGPLVMTSGNLPGRPMCASGPAVLDRLGAVIDAALLHDREIVARCDDSVTRFHGADRRFLRRSRGWVPESLPRPDTGDGAQESLPRPDTGSGAPDLLAVGPAFDATVALARGGEIYLSQHVGDVENPATVAFHREARRHLAAITGVEPSVVACDLHPDFETTAVAERLAAEDLSGPVRVQHHHAHAASLLAEHGRERAIVVTADGTGYGPDGSVWGGEVLDATPGDYERVGGLDTFRLPGGQAAIDSPARLLASLLPAGERTEALLVERNAVADRAAAANVRRQCERGVNAPQTTSAGRYLDAVSAMLGVCTERHYEGEPAMKLEAVAAGGDPLPYDVPMDTRDGGPVVDTAALVRDMTELASEEPTRAVAATAQRALADGLATVALTAARERGVATVGFTGGVAYNAAIAGHLAERVEESGRRFLAHDRVPPGDGGIAYGQAVVATVD
ncbi:MAG: carbamoyltransferase HypF [Haloarculaceae archaeon]